MRIAEVVPAREAPALQTRLDPGCEARRRERAVPLAAVTVFPANRRNRGDGLALLSDIADDELRAVFFDPQYRGVLDKLKYGNEGKRRGRARSSLPQMSPEVIRRFLEEISRVLTPSGYLFLWVDKFQLVDGVAPRIKGLSLVTVDMITWDKARMGMGYRTRRQAEYLVVIQKPPVAAKKTWSLHNIPDVWRENVVKRHPHSKPVGLQKQLILATTEPGDFVCDPAAGGFSVLDACALCGRNFIGCDIAYEEEGEGRAFGFVRQ